MPTAQGKDMKPLFTMDWVRELNWTIRIKESTTSLTEQTEKDRKLINFGKLFKTNQTIEDSGIKIQLKPGYPPAKQKIQPIPSHLQSYVDKEMNKPIQYGHFEIIQKVEDCFISPVVVTLKEDKSVEIVLDSKN